MDGNQQSFSKLGERKIIRPYDLEQSLFYTSFTSDQTLNYQVDGLDTIKDENGIVLVNKVPHRISRTNRELIPIAIEPQDSMYLAQPNSILTTRFSVCLHIFLANLKFNPKNRIYIMEAQNTLGTPQSVLNSISCPYTSSLIQSRVIQDVYSQQGDTNDVLGLTKLIFHYLELTSGEIVGLFKDNEDFVHF